MGTRIANSLDQFFNNMIRRRQIRIAHAEVDNIFALRARLRLQFVDLFKHIRRQALNTLKVLCHKSSLASLIPCLCHQIAAN